MSESRAVYVLRGHFAGQTVTLGGFSFLKGRLTALGYTPEQLELLDRHLAQWQGVRVDGECPVQEDGGEEVPGDVQSNGEGPEAGTTVNDSGVNDDPEARNARKILEPDRDRQAAKLRKAIEALDPKVDADWTQAGKPALAAVERLLGYAGLTRADVEAAAPGFVRRRG